MTRRLFLGGALGWAAFSTNALAISFHCTPAPSFPVPLTEGVWRSQEFPVGRHNYILSLEVDRRKPLEALDCDLGPPRDGHHCEISPLLNLEWRIFDGPNLVKSYSNKPLRASGWSTESTSCVLGYFAGKRDGRFVLELDVKTDAGDLKLLNPRVEIVKNPGYWCWL